MKKYLYSALALPLLFACSSEDLSEQAVVSSDQFAGIAKVEATFSMDEGTTRFDAGEGSWVPEEGDLWGFAWLTDDHTATPAYTPLISIDGNAYQNHNLIQKSNYFEPQTSIYVGKYYIYRPYDKTTVAPQAINFKSLEQQPLAEGYESAKQPWKNLGKTAINIGDKWTEVTPGGHTIGTDPTIWDKAGIKEHYKLYAALFSNQTGLDLTYKKNNPTFAAKTKIKGATDIDYDILAGTAVGAADIYEATVALAGAAKSFTYAPTKEPNTGTHSSSFWADKSNLPTAAQDGFSFTAGLITLTPADAVNGLSTGENDSKGWFWFNSLPVIAGDGDETTTVQTIFTTSYGVVTVNKTLEDCAYAFEQPDGAAATAPKEWIKIVSTATDQSKSPKEWNLGDAGRKTFVNQYGNHKGKYAFDVDFSTGNMNGMHIKSDAHLQKLLKYYLASGKTNSGIILNLDQAGSGANNVFKISKISIALLQTINASGIKVLVQACTSHGTPKIIVTQDGQAEIDHADATEVPDLNKVFATPTAVYLSKDCNWTWKERTGTNQLTVDANVASLTNEGKLTVNAKNVQLTTSAPIKNAAGAIMNIKKVTTVKNALTNLGEINVGVASNTSAEFLAYGIAIVNDATTLTDHGVINNYGTVAVSAGTGGSFNNYGYIDMKSNGAITLLTSNELNGASSPYGPFNIPFAAASNMMGTVVLPTGNAYAIVSVSNTAETGFIKYNWTGGSYTHDAGNVKYNTIVVSNDIAFTGANSTEIQFIEFKNNSGDKKIQVVNPSSANKLPNLKGIIVNDGTSIVIEKNNIISCSDGAFLGSDARVYKGGVFNYVSTNNYLGTWSLVDQVREW